MDAERQYHRFLLQILDEVRRVFAPLLAALPNLLPRVDGVPYYDTTRRWDNADHIKQLLDDIKAQMGKALDIPKVKQVLRAQESAVQAHSEREFHKQTKAALGVDIFARDPKQVTRAAAYVTGNVERVQNLAAETANKLSAAILQAVQDGKSYDDLSADLADQFGFAESRAATIARDQIGKLYGQINADRQKALGLSKFIWRTSNDGRVREEHAALEGEVFSYDDPPAEGLPGEPINCRCHAEPYFDDLLKPDET